MTMEWDEKAELEGILARSAYKVSDTNPYAFGTDARHWWTKGWEREDSRQRSIEWASYRPGTGS